MYFRLTLFNGITIFVGAATVLVALARRRCSPKKHWFGAYYAIIAAFWYFFGGSLGTAWVAAGVAAAVALRSESLPRKPLLVVRTVEYVFFGYVLWRCAALLLMLPW